jgi:two-component system chemotaxis sensor kinase CheA
MDEIVKDFLIESNENLDRLDQELVKLESEPSSKELLASIFRTIHTIKGSCGFLGFARLEKVAHAGENLLSRLRDGELSLNAKITSALLGMVDAVRYMLSEIQATEHDGENDYPELREELKRLQNTESRQQSAAASISSSVRILPASERESSTSAEISARTTPELKPPVQTRTQALSPIDAPQYRPAPGRIGALLVEQGNVKADQLAQALYEQERGDQRRLGEILVALEFCKQDDVNAAQQLLESRTRERDAGVETVRVGVNLLDRLMNLVGELVLARNQLVQFSSTTQDAGLLAISQRMSLIATELQEQTMKTRMQPIGNIWNKFQRTVRDLALGCGKEVRLEMEGQDTELDRTIIEAIKDPLTHLVRNSVDHGIEAPEIRKQKGKDSSGCLRLRAYHEGGQVNIEIIDDGAGLNSERIRNKAIERGLITPEQAARMPERETFNLIFMPGFSTAEKITNVSGRGVGMDVVKTNVEKIGGMVDVQSALGKGTTVRVKIPLTLAIIPALLVTCQGERFAIPQISLTELVRLEGEQKVEMVHGAPVYRLRGSLLPLVYLGRELQLTTEASNLANTGQRKIAHDEIKNIAVLQAEDRKFGLVVDDVIDTEEIVVKPLGKQLKGLSMYSGATIMGDGRVALILDVLGLAQQAKVIAEARDSTLSEKDKASLKEETATDRQTLLLIQNGERGHMAIPLSLVARLEEFPTTSIENTGDQEVMQYRGQIMPLVRLAHVIPSEDDVAPEDGSLQVVVYSASGQSVGLVVDRIVDIVNEKFVVQNPMERPGVLGSSVIQQRVTDLVDVPGLIRGAIPNFAERGV